jgi:glycosyltransferase involved in cell wall biosynthesis
VARLLTANVNERNDSTASVTIHVRIVGPVDAPGTPSTRRYATDLTAALTAIEGTRPERALPPTGEPGPFEPFHGRRFPLRHQLGELRRALRRRRTAWRTSRLSGDVFHLVDQRDARLLEALPAERTVQTVHDLLTIQSDPDSPDAELMRAYLTRAARVVAISQATRSEILEHTDVDPDRVSVIPNGLDERFRPVPPARLILVHDLLPTTQYRVLHVAANTQPRKNIAATIRVLAELRQQGLDVLLVRSGARLPAAEAELAAELHVDEWIADLGYVDDERLVELYNAADALLFPSSYEGFGWPPLEAMACGLPVVASNAAALPEVLGPPADLQGIGGASLQAAPDDLATLTSHVAAVLTDRTLSERLSEAGRLRAAQFGWDQTARRYLELYRELLAP